MKRLPIHNWRFWLILFAAGMTVLLAATLWYVPFIVREVKNPVASLFNDTLIRIQPPEFDKYRLNGRLFTFTTQDSLEMSGFIVPADSVPKGTVVALHGYRSNKNKYLPVVRYFTRAGYDFIAVDLRGHNMSEGDFTGFSYLEKNDIDALIDYLEANGMIRGKLILYGHSIGAATALAVAVKRDDVDALILESIFTSFDRIIPNYIRFYTGVSADSLPPEAEKFIFDQIRIPADSIRPVDMAPSVRIPAFVAHGGKDVKVPWQQGKEVYARLNGPKKFFLIDSATHNTLWEQGGPAYFQALIEFLDSMAQSKSSNSL